MPDLMITCNVTHIELNPSGREFISLNEGESRMVYYPNITNWLNDRIETGMLTVRYLTPLEKLVKRLNEKPR